MIDPHTALCCLISSAAASATAAGVPFVHAYPTAALTWPYCTHDAVIGRHVGQDPNPPPSLTGEPPAFDAPTNARVAFDVFDLTVLRCGPPYPEIREGAVACPSGFYGDCSSPVDNTTLAGHHALVAAETERLRSELLERWCSCLVLLDAGYSRTRPRWVDSVTVENEGRFTGVTFRVAGLLN